MTFLSRFLRPPLEDLGVGHADGLEQLGDEEGVEVHLARHRDVRERQVDAHLRRRRDELALHGRSVVVQAPIPTTQSAMIAWGDTEEVDVDSSRVTKFKGASGSSKLLLQCRRSRHVFGAVWSVVSVSQSVAGTQCSGP